MHRGTEDTRLEDVIDENHGAKNGTFIKDSDFFYTTKGTSRFKI